MRSLFYTLALTVAVAGTSLALAAETPTAGNASSKAKTIQVARAKHPKAAKVQKMSHKAKKATPATPAVPAEAPKQ